ncbi:hypothetical protein BU17DRAFT_72839 [Hysterangium stoloniferum]|nr:hypothetical protein BU17DRAFT_72839 [Hysterangium stoloniferum]
MANAKATFYTTHLYLALIAGNWTSELPSRAIRKGGLDWPELLRKFRKHRPEAGDIAEVASYTQALSLLLLRSQFGSPEALDGYTDPTEPLQLGAECSLPDERKDEARMGYELLQKLNESESVRLALSYYAFALGRFQDALEHLSLVEFEELTSSVNASNVGSVSTTLSVPMSYGTEATGATAGSAAASFTPSIAALDSGVKNGELWRITQLIRGKYIQGAAHESLPNASLSNALAAYESALPLLNRINIPKSLPSVMGRGPTESFTRYRELWRWVERLLWRATILSAKSQSLSHTHHILKVYQVHSVHWPTTFRPEHRSTMAQLHLHLLLQTFSPTLRTPWLNELRSIVTDYRVLLTATTSFPRAGERNVKVEEFVDLCMGAWEVYGASGDQVAWVIEILWWATRFTFNSQRIYRHLARTLYVSGDTELARRTLRLYVQVVSKAREAGTCDESDRIWVETLVQGARMLCRVPGGVAEAQEAGDLIIRAEKKLDIRDHATSASVLRAKGIWHACMAIREEEPSTRPAHLASSLAAFKESLELHPIPSTYFHLALALTRPGPARDFSAAVACAQEAVTGDPKEVRYWHLLGLLLAATEKWKPARGVLDYATGIEEEEEEEEEVGGGGGNIDEQTDRMLHTVKEKEDIMKNSHLEDGRCLLDANSCQLPAAATFQRPVPDYPRPTRHERFEHALQLRFTQLALIEHVDGPENAGVKWLEVFSWVAERKGLGEERRPPSVEPPSSDGQPDTQSRPSPRQSHTPLILSRPHSPLENSSGIPINLIPPSPIPIQNAETNGMDGFELRYNNKEKEKEKEKEGHDTSKGKKVQRILKDRVNKGQAHINTISRKIGASHGLRIKRSTSAPDFHLALTVTKPYQASSIHSRQRLSTTYMRANSPEPPLRPISPKKQPSVAAGRSQRERRLLSNLWLTSAATFRRTGKIEQSRAAIQEAEMADDKNADVWVQLGLYFAALGEVNQAIRSFHKALFIQPDHVPAYVYLTQQYLTSTSEASTNTSDTQTEAESSPSKDNIDLAAGLLSNLTRGAGWDVPEAWYFLARARGLQGKRDRERECLTFALGLMEGRSIRDIMSAVGWCL